MRQIQSGWIACYEIDNVDRRNGLSIPEIEINDFSLFLEKN